MTTIVYDHKNKMIAIDGRQSAGNEIKMDNAIKWRKDGDNIYFLCGHVSDYENFLSHQKKVGTASDVKIEVGAIRVSNGVAYKCSFDDDEYWEHKLECSDGLGSGGVYALSALDFGLDVREAVEYAKKKDIYSGGKVTVFDVEKMEFVE